MIRSRFSLLGALLAAVGLIALFASSAQAEVGAKWLILKTVGGGGGLETLAEMEAEEFEGTIENKTASLLATILSIPLELLCTAGKLINAHPGPEGSVKKGALVEFTGCMALNATTKAKLTNCNPKSPGAEVGTIKTLDGHALLKLHILKNAKGEEIGKDDTLLILPDDEVNEHFVTVEMGEGCAVGEEVPIKGLLAVWGCSVANPATENCTTSPTAQQITNANTNWLAHNATHLITEFRPLTTLKAANQPATLDGSANVVLHSGRQYAGDPG